MLLRRRLLFPGFPFLLLALLSFRPLSLQASDTVCDANPFGTLRIAAVPDLPFAAEKISTTFRILPDGSRKKLVLRVPAQIARDRMGRVAYRSPIYAPGQLPGPGIEPRAWTVQICDPVSGTVTRINPGWKSEIKIDQSGLEVETLTSFDPGAVSSRHINRARSGFLQPFHTDDEHPQQLGQRNVGGVSTLGYRFWVRHNGQLTEDNFETQWLSPDLMAEMLDTYTIKTDELEFGSLLTNIRREDPDPGLFQIPPGYKVVDALSGAPLESPSP